MSCSMIKLDQVSKTFMRGVAKINALGPISMSIHEGEFIAIVGASGSGKSTLMNILGGLDRPTSGVYWYKFINVNSLDSPELANLRCRNFGFVFQEYNLLAKLTALQNVELPAIYAGMARAERLQRAQSLLSRLGLNDRTDHKPAQLSGGQQQRVSIARALMNDADVILADEPTGALDVASAQEVMCLLKELNASGKTIILITHDEKIASNASRVIRLEGGLLVSDESKNCPSSRALSEIDSGIKKGVHQGSASFVDALRMALHALSVHKMKSFLSMLGIIIGISAVVTVASVGEGAKTKIINDIMSLGANTLEIFPGVGWGDERANSVYSLSALDLFNIRSLGFVREASPVINLSGKIRWQGRAVNGALFGVSESYFSIKKYQLIDGRFFDGRDLSSSAPVATIDAKSVDELFSGASPLNQIVLVGDLPVKIIGIIDVHNRADTPLGISLWLPYTTLQTRMTMEFHFPKIIAQLQEGVRSEEAEQRIGGILHYYHGKKDFFFFSNDFVLKSANDAANTLMLLVVSIALISLMVGGVGVMNIMLATVMERAHEIGIRISVGAHYRHILAQFLLESTFIAVSGGVVGVAASFFFTFAFDHIVSDFQTNYSMGALAAAILFSMLIGIVFGYLPAHKAARLNPVDVLNRV